MDTCLYLVRHGVTKWNELGIYQGHHDPPLSALGKKQATQVARVSRK